ncbi:MAG: DMT family transporter [Actinocatenispora sp.]
MSGRDVVPDPPVAATEPVGAGPPAPAADRPGTGLLPPPVALAVAVVGGVGSAVQGVVNGGLAERVGTPVVAALISNGVGTTLLLLGACTFPSVRAGLRRLPGSGLRWWQYLGGVCGALFVAGSALTVPILGVALVTVVLVCGTSLGGILTDRIGLGPTGRLPVTPVRLISALAAVAAVGIAQLGRPVGQVALGLVVFVLVLGLGLSVQSALNGRLMQTARNVGSASLVNALVGTTVLVVATGVFGAAGRLPVTGLTGDWWLYLGGVLSLVVVGANLLSVRSLGVLRTGLAFVAGQLVGALVLDAVVPGQVRPTGWLIVGVLLTLGAVLLSGVATARRPTRPARPAREGADS